jgi:hypothetical protein
MSKQDVPARPEHGSTADYVPTAITALVWSLGVGLFAAAQCLPLHWLPGQALILLLLLIALPAAMVFGEQRLAGMVGLAAGSYASRLRITSLAVIGLLAIALPVYQGQHGGMPAGTNDLAISVVIGAGLSLLVRATAAAMAHQWGMLFVQPWERSDDLGGVLGSAVQFEAAGRVDRSLVIQSLWRWWLAGDIALATALLLCAQLASPGYAWEQALLLGALIAYTALGLAVLSQAARLRQTIVWGLDGQAVSPALSRRWNGLSLQAGVLAMVGVYILIALHVLDAVYAAEDWLFWNVVVPLIDWIGNWFGQSHPLRDCTQISFCQSATPPRIPRLGPLGKPPPSTPHPGGPDLSWLLHNWPLLLAVVALALIARGFLGGRGRRNGRSLWREIIATLLRDLRSLVTLLARFLQRRATVVGNALRQRAGSALQRRIANRARSAPANAREAVIALYLAALGYAARRGHPRRAGQTPGEYAQELSGVAPEAGAELAGMTDLFVQVRYGNVLATGEQISLMQRLWGSFRRYLPKGRKKDR